MRLLGIDIGTTSCKALLINETGNIIARAEKSYCLLTPQPGWTEQNPDDWAGAARECVAEIGNYDAIGFTGQMHGSVFLDAAGNVIRPALLWNDQRTVTEVQQMIAGAGLKTIVEETCNPPLTGFQAPKILWLRNNEPDNFAKLRRVLLPKDYVRKALTGEERTDVSDASGTGLFNVAKRNWSTILLDLFDLHDLLPQVEESLSANGAGDQAAGAVGVGAVTSNVMSISLGTSGVVFSPQDTPAYDEAGHAHTFCHANGKWHSMSVMLSCGGALSWARDNFSFNSYDEMALLAGNAKASNIEFKPYLAGERSPHNDPNLRGSLIGLSLSDGRSELALAIFEGITFALKDGFDVVRGLRDTMPAEIRITGGGAQSDYWMRLIADAFNCTTLRMQVDEGPAFGAAVVAGVGASIWPSLELACRSIVRTGDRFEPDSERHALLEKRRRRRSSNLK